MPADKDASAGRVEASNRIMERVALGVGGVLKSMGKIGLTGQGEGKEKEERGKGRQEENGKDGCKKTQSESLHQHWEFIRCSDRRIHIRSI